MIRTCLSARCAYRKRSATTQGRLASHLLPKRSPKREASFSKPLRLCSQLPEREQGWPSSSICSIKTQSSCPESCNLGCCFPLTHPTENAQRGSCSRGEGGIHLLFAPTTATLDRIKLTKLRGAGEDLNLI